MRSPPRRTRLRALAAGFPLVFGGDLNLRPRTSPALFDALERAHGLIGVTAPAAIDHLLTAGLADAGEAEVLPAGWREMADRHTGLLLRLSDHSPVARELVLP